MRGLIGPLSTALLVMTRLKGDAMTTVQTGLKDAMEIIAEGTALAMTRLFRDGAQEYVGKLDNWTGQYSLTDHYEPHDAGFLMGRLWLLYRYTGEERYKNWALRTLNPMTQDLLKRPVRTQASGIDIFYGLCWAADITGSEQSKEQALRATENLVRSLWSEKAGVFLTAQDRISVNIDAAACLFSLPWGAEYDSRFMKYWIAHNDTILQLKFIRPDGSTFQSAHFDEQTHKFLYFTTWQGWRPESTWARGHAWAIHNFTAAYEATGLQRFLDAAVTVADWWVKNIPVDYIPHYDFNDPDRASKPKDCCSAAITANALIRLCKLKPDLAPRYRPVVEGTLHEIATRYFTIGGIVLHGSWGNLRLTASRPMRFPQEDVMPYSNYFFVEALYRELVPDWRFLSLKPE